jgi:peptidoglycan LD-endopeptidase CwlK
MPKFGKKSREQLATCDKRLQEVFNEVIKSVDCTILEGYRNEEDQNKAYDKGNSKVKYPNGRHNSKPCLAVDCLPYPIDWKDLERMTLFAGYVLGTAEQMGIKLVWGNDWDRDFQTSDTNFKDYPHFELHRDELKK